MWQATKTYLRTYQTIRYNKSENGPSGYFHNLLRFFLWFLGLVYVLHNMEFLLRYNVTGTVRLTSFRVLYETQGVHSWYCNTSLSSPIWKECFSSFSFNDEPLVECVYQVPSDAGNGVSTFEMITSYWNTSRNSWMLMNAPELVWVPFSMSILWKNNHQESVLLKDDFVTSDGFGSREQAQNVKYRRQQIQLSRLLELANVNLDTFNEDSETQCPYRFTGLTLNAYVTCSNLKYTFSRNLECTLQVLVEPLEGTTLDDQSHMYSLESRLWFSRTNCVRVIFHPIVGEMGEMTIFKTILALIATGRFVVYATPILEHIIKKGLEMFISSYVRRTGGIMYDGRWHKWVNQLFWQLNEDLTTHNIDADIRVLGSTDEFLYQVM